MRGAANTWFSALEEAERNDFKALRERFATKYAPAPISLWKRASEFWVQEQRPGQSVEDFYHEMKCRAREVGATDDTTRFALMKGLKNALRTYVMQQNPASCEEWLEAAKVAEATVVETPSTTTSELMEAMLSCAYHSTCSLELIRHSLEKATKSSQRYQPTFTQSYVITEAQPLNIQQVLDNFTKQVDEFNSRGSDCQMENIHRFVMNILAHRPPVRQQLHSLTILVKEKTMCNKRKKLARQ